MENLELKSTHHFFRNACTKSGFNLLFFHIFRMFSLFNLPFFHIFSILKIWKIWKKGQLNTEKIWKIWNLNQPTISLEMPVPSQGRYGFYSFPHC
jgi:hypothetical protein